VAAGVAYTRETIVFCVESYDASSLSVSVADFECGADPVGAAFDCIPVRDEGVEQGADVVVGIVFFKRYFWIGPDLYHEDGLVYVLMDHL
jgi:hypothetical protein